jgi:hypothetical protein
MHVSILNTYIIESFYARIVISLDATILAISSGCLMCHVQHFNTLRPCYWAHVGFFQLSEQFFS